MSEKIQKPYPSNTKTHVAVLAPPALGHIIPLFEFSKRLVINHHFHITFLVIATTEPSPAQDHLLNPPNLPSYLDVVHLPPVDVSTTIPDPDTPLLTLLSLIIQESLKSLKTILIERLNPLHAFVGDMFTSKAFDIVKEVSEIIPVYTFFTSPASFLAFCLYFPTLNKEVEGEIVDQPGPVLVPGCSPVRNDDLLDEIKNRNSEDYNWFLWHMNRLTMADGILLNTWEELEPVSLKAIRENRFFLELQAPPVYPVGPVVGGRNDESEILTEPDGNCLAWLDEQPSESVLFVCLGSGGTLTAQQIGEMAWGLEQSRQRFLWVVRKPTDATASVLAPPALGHIIPLFEFSKRLVANHHFHVTFLVITTTEPSLTQDNLLNSPTHLDVVHLPPVDVSATIPDPDTPLLTLISILIQESLKSLKIILMERLNPLHAFVGDMFTSKAFDIVKEVSEIIPVYTFFASPASFLAFCLYFPTLGKEVEGEIVNQPGPVLVPGCLPVRTNDLVDQVKNRNSEDYNWFLWHMNRLAMADGILVNTWEELEPVSLRAIRENRFFLELPAPPVYPVGPVVGGCNGVSEILKESDVNCVAWLDEQPSESVLFICLGSRGTLTAQQIGEMAWGLELSRQRFLWVVRKPADAPASGAFFNVGSDENDPKAYLPEGFLKRTQEFGLVVPTWVAQKAILSHPSVGAFLSHCGWNSVVESITFGLPIIAWPLYAEQKINAAMLAEDVGIALRPVAKEEMKVVGREEIEKVVRMVMEGEEGKVIRGKVRKLKESAEKTLNWGGSSYDSLINWCEGVKNVELNASNHGT